MITRREKQEIISLVSCFAKRVDYIEYSEDLINQLLIFIKMNNKYLTKKDLITIDNCSAWYEDIVLAVKNGNLSVEDWSSYWVNYEFITEEEVDELDGNI